MAVAAALFLLAAAPRTVPIAPASVTQLSNGARIVTHAVADTPLISAQLFVPAGIAFQSPDQAGIAAVAADMVLHSPASNGKDVIDIANGLGASATYELDPGYIRFEITCRSVDMAPLLAALATALAHPNPSQFVASRASVLSVANASAKNPVAAALAMVRQVNYDGSGYQSPDAGSPSTIVRLTQSQVSSFLNGHARAGGAVLALSGDLNAAVVDGARAALQSLPSGAAQSAPTGRAVTRSHQVVAHRSVDQPWVAIGYQAPVQFSNDYPTMLVVEALLGQGGDSRALTLGSDTPLPSDFVGAYYQYEAQPGAFIVFLNGEGTGGVDASIRELQLAIARLRAQRLPQSLVERGREIALGDYYMSVTTLDDDAWLIGTATLSPHGPSYVNELPRAIAAVTPADVQRVAQRYLARETLGVVLPASSR